MGSFYDVLEGRVNDLKKLKKAKDRGDRVQTYVPTGLAKWDANGGIELGVLTLVAMPSGDGKSHVALHLAAAAAKAGFEVVLFSFEDPPRKTADRQLATGTGLRAVDLGRIEFDETAVAQMDVALAEAKEWAKRIDYRSGLVTSDEMLEYLDTPEGRKKKMRLCDYAQAFPEAENKTMEATLREVAWRLNEQAQRDDAAAVVLAQTVPEVEVRGRDWFDRHELKGYPMAVEGYRPGPGKHDVAWCKGFYERAKAVAYGYRPGRWARKHKMMKNGRLVPDDRIEFAFDKVNFATEGNLVVGFDGAHSRLYDLNE